MKKISLVTLTISALLIFAMTSCKTAQEDNGSNTDPKNTNGGSVQLEIDKKYLTEGFVDRDIFRIVIVSDSDSENLDVEEVKSKARQRAILTLRKFILSKNKKFDSNVRAEILKLVNSSGKLYEKQIDQRKQKVFYFDVKRGNIKQHINKITTERRY